jgi:hypothetical protein
MALFFHFCIQVFSIIFHRTNYFLSLASFCFLISDICYHRFIRSFKNWTNTGSTANLIFRRVRIVQYLLYMHNLDNIFMHGWISIIYSCDLSILHVSLYATTITTILLSSSVGYNRSGFILFYLLLVLWQM